MQVGQAGQKTGRRERQPKTPAITRNDRHKKRLRPYGALVRLLLYRVTKGMVRG
jgi:hypothetical protein